MWIGYMIIICYSLCSGLLYVALMYYFSTGLYNSAIPTPNKQSDPLFISVVVCFRNEEAYLPKLLKSLAEQSYPADAFEILLYNDASSDGSIALIKNLQAHYSSHKIIYTDVPVKQGCNSAKKLAINDAVKNSKADLIAVTDADCILHTNWLAHMAQCYSEEKAVMIAGPVAIEKESGWLNELQILELQALAAVTAGAIGNKKPVMCNGANLAFDRNTFLSLDPYKYNHHISSGDDMFLMMAMEPEHSKDIHFLGHREAIVFTKGKETIGSYLNQRIRWASKSKSYQQYRVKLIALLVLNYNAIPFVALLMIPRGPYFIGLILLISVLIIKQLGEMLLLSKFSKLMDLKVNYLKLFLYQFVEALLTVVIALNSIKGSYVWKERKQHF